MRYSKLVSSTGAPLTLTVCARVSSSTGPQASLELAQPPVAAQQRRQPRLHLGEMKWLGDVVVGSGAQPLDLVLPAIARGQYQHAVGLAARAQLADQFEAGQFRQTQIDDRDVDRVFGGRVQAFLAIGGKIDAVAGRYQIGLQRLAQRRFVLHYQHAHSRPLDGAAQGTSAPLRASTRTIHTLPADDSSRNTYRCRPP